MWRWQAPQALLVAALETGGERLALRLQNGALSIYFDGDGDTPLPPDMPATVELADRAGL